MAAVLVEVPFPLARECGGGVTAPDEAEGEMVRGTSDGLRECTRLWFPLPLSELVDAENEFEFESSGGVVAPPFALPLTFESEYEGETDDGGRSGAIVR